MQQHVLSLPLPYSPRAWWARMAHAPPPPRVIVSFHFRQGPAPPRLIADEQQRTTPNSPYACHDGLYPSPRATPPHRWSLESQISSDPPRNFVHAEMLCSGLCEGEEATTAMKRRRREQQYSSLHYLSLPSPTSMTMTTLTITPVNSKAIPIFRKSCTPSTSSLILLHHLSPSKHHCPSQSKPKSTTALMRNPGGRPKIAVNAAAADGSKHSSLRLKRCAKQPWMRTRLRWDVNLSLVSFLFDPFRCLLFGERRKGMKGTLVNKILMDVGFTYMYMTNLN